DHLPLDVQAIPLAEVLLRGVDREALRAGQEAEGPRDRVDSLRDVADEAPYLDAVDAGEVRPGHRLLAEALRALRERVRGEPEAARGPYRQKPMAWTDLS